jgi:hypothetical protein
MARELHPAESRGYRELYAYSRQLIEHWSALSSQAAGPAAEPLAAGVRAVRELLGELEPVTASYGLHGKPAAQGAGAQIARQRTVVRDRFLERGQALRFAVEDVVHLCVLLAYLRSVAESRGDATLAEFCGRWERKLRRHESAVRKAAAELGGDPDGAVEPLHSSAVGRAAHGVGFALGTAGEWFDRRAASRKP